jgi:signal transduction histidine kinase
LIHGLQGSVAGLRAVVAAREVNGAVETDWESAADYTDRMQTMIQEIVGLLGDNTTQTSYELTGNELAEIVRRRNAPIAEKKGVVLEVSSGFNRSLDNHRGGLLCLVINNLVQNSVEATPAHRTVAVILRQIGETVEVLISDEGGGIPESIRPHLFQPGRSGRAGGTGLGLAISKLLARQINADLSLESTGTEGTVFRISLPLKVGDRKEFLL